MMTFTMYHSGRAGVQENTYYKNAIEIRNADDLAAACLYDNVCVQFANNHRSNADFQRCFAIAADCDNSGTDNPLKWITPATVAERLPGVQFYDCASRNNNKTKHPGEPGEEGPRPRYHYYFPLSEPITDIKQARAVMSMLLRLFPEFDDNGTKPAQFFYGHSAPITAAHDGTIDIVQYLASRPELQPKPEPKQTPKKTTPDPRLSADKEDYFTLNIEDALKYISPDDYDDWIKVGQGLYTAGKKHNVNCFDLWDSWSSGSKLYKGIEETRKKWATFKDAGADRTADERTIFNMAKSQGWHQDPDKLTGEYKAKHEERVKRIAEEKRIEEEFQNLHRAEHAAALAAVGIDCAGDPYRYTWTLDFDGAIDEVVEKETGEIKYHRSEEERAAARAAANSLRPDPQQTTEIINGVTVHNVPGGTSTEANGPADARKELVVSGFEDVIIKPTNYLFFPWFPRGKLVAIQGDSGSSKSTFTYAVGAKVSTGADLLGTPCEDPGNVMFITIEDDESDILIAFLDAGGDISHLKRIKDREQIAALDLSPAGADAINNIIKQHNIKLLVLDPLQQFLAGDMNKANETRTQLARLMNIAAENNICIAFLEHMGKDTTKAALHRGLGSVDIHAATRSVIQVVTDPEDDYFKIAFTVKNNTADFHDTQRAIRYQVKDHPGNNKPGQQKRERFHGHAEFSAILTEYNEKLYRRAVRKADEAADEETALSYQYDEDPLTLAARDLIAENPQGLFIGTDDLIQRITQVCGHCPYDQTKNKATGIYVHVAKLRTLMIDTDGIQMDIQSNSIYPKSYNWRGALTEPPHIRTKGITFTPVKAKQDGSQQTKI